MAVEHQSEVNQREWDDPLNWGGGRIVAVYFSQRDSRLWVPKRVPAFGWTLNLAHPWGARLLVAILVGLVAALVAVAAFAC